MRGVQEVSTQATEAACSIPDLFRRDRSRIDDKPGRATGSTLRVHDLLQRRLVLTTTHAMELLGLARPDVLNALENLQDLDMVRKRIGKERCRLHVYDRCSNIFDEAPLHGNLLQRKMPPRAPLF